MRADAVPFTPLGAPNVLLVVFDTARSDAVEPYGAPSGATPATADLARRGRAFEHAYATSSWTLPSHASMFSGLLPRRLGLAQSPGGVSGARPLMEAARSRLLPSILSRHGYATRGWVTNLWVSRTTGFDLGFDEFAFVDSGRTERVEALLGKGRRARLAWAREGLRSAADDGAAEVGRQLRESIGRWDGRPTFWFVNLTECHSPYLPPRPWNDLPALDRARAALEARRHLNFMAICLHAAGRWEIPPDALERMQHLYRRAISYMDDWLAGVLEALDARGILDETLVIVTSDHGENFGEGGLMAHGFSLDQRLIRVPLVMGGPGVPADRQVISLADLPLVIAEAAGVEEVPWRADELPDGVAVAQYDPMAARDSERIRQFGEQHDIPEAGLDRLCASYTTVSDGRHKLVVRDGVEALYDLTADPNERSPLAPDVRADVLGRLRAALSHPALEERSEEPAVPARPPAAAPDEVEAIERQMKLLGYM